MKVQIKTLLKEPFEPAPPLAIRMANNLDLAVLDPMWPDEAVVPKHICEQASAELRRLHKANQALWVRLAQPEFNQDYYDALTAAYLDGFHAEREWVGLTDEDKHYLNEVLNLQGRFPVIDAIEAKLRSKNT